MLIYDGVRQVSGLLMDPTEGEGKVIKKTISRICTGVSPVTITLPMEHC